MKWTRTIRPGGPVYVSADRKAIIHLVAERFLLRVVNFRKGKRLDIFDELTDAQEAYEKHDMSKGLRARSAAARAG